jgi:predicted N-formylglutamate amidohydrolase
VPAEYAALFAGASDVLATHRGFDLGALEIARAFGQRLDVEPFAATVTRLVVDLNRSPRNRNVFSQFSRRLSVEQRSAALARYYWPYRNAVEETVARAVTAGQPVVHVSTHSFTPVLRNEVRKCDIGFLYDPKRRGEVRFVEAWHTALRAEARDLTVRRNYPYRGVSDSLVTYLRRRYHARGYVGLELEVNQKHVATTRWRSLVEALCSSLAAAIERHVGLPARAPNATMP